MKIFKSDFVDFNNKFQVGKILNYLGNCIFIFEMNCSYYFDKFFYFL